MIFGRQELGSIDAPLEELVGLINGDSRMFTTSCCSGRVAVTGQPGPALVQKEGLEWIFMTHEKISDIEQLIKLIKDRIEDTKIDQEATILFKFEGLENV